MRSLILFLLLASALVYASPNTSAPHPVTYQVVINTPDRESEIVGVAVGQEVYGLAPDPTVPMLYTGIGPSSSTYRYVILDKNDNSIVHFEPFERPPIEHANSTFYETYGRPWNKLELPELPQLYKFEPKDPAASPLYEDGTIITLHFNVDEGQTQSMHENKYDKKSAKVNGTMTYISYNNVQQFHNVELKIGGHSSRRWAKVPYKIKIPQKSAPDGLYKRWSFKLRSEATDPTMMREMLYNDLLKSTGILAARGVYARMYINDHPAGLYLLVDDSGSSSFIKETIHQGEDNVTIGDLIQGDAGKGAYAANLGFIGDTADAYDDKVYKVKKAKTAEQKEAAMQPLIEFMQFIDSYDPEEAPENEDMLLEQWKPYIDAKQFIRQMALEWIGGNWDAVQYSGNNYAMYRHPSTGQYITIPMDFDYTFGNGLEEDQRNLMTGEWPEFTAGRKTHSFLWERIKAIPQFVKMYQDTLRDINTHVSNPENMFKRIDGLAYMLQRDVVWDRSLERFTDGLTRPWSAEDFLGSLEHGSGQQDEQIGLKEWISGKSESIMKMQDLAPSGPDGGLGVGFYPFKEEDLQKA